MHDHVPELQPLESGGRRPDEGARLRPVRAAQELGVPATARYLSIPCTCCAGTGRLRAGEVQSIAFVQARRGGAHAIPVIAIDFTAFPP